MIYAKDKRYEVLGQKINEYMVKLQRKEEHFLIPLCFPLIHSKVILPCLLEIEINDEPTSPGKTQDWFQHLQICPGHLYLVYLLRTAAYMFARQQNKRWCSWIEYVFYFYSCLRVDESINTNLESSLGNFYHFQKRILESHRVESFSHCIPFWDFLVLYQSFILIWSHHLVSDS